MLRKRFPLTLQHDSMQCGVACLDMVCRHYGRHYGMDSISRYCHATREGVSMKGISEAAHDLGFQTVCGKMELSRLSEIPLPCILHWDQEHFVVLYRVRSGGKHFYVADPGKRFGYL